MKMRFPDQVRGLINGLMARLVLLLSMALLPLGAISISSTAEMQRAAQRAGERGLITLAADSVAGERALIESALASARSLEPLVLAQRDDPEACQSLLRDYIDRSSIHSFAGFIDRDGVLICRSQGEAVNFAQSATFLRLRAAPVTTLSVSPAGVATGLPVIIITRPVISTDGLEGFLTISIASGTLESIMQRRIEDAPAVAVLINHEGAVLNLQAQHEAHMLLPASDDLATLAARPASRVMRGTTREGVPVMLATAELIPGRVQALAVWQLDAPALAVLETSVLPLLFPAVMWLACLFVVLLSVHYLVVRYLKGLNRQMRRFALGWRDDWVGPPAHAPAEIRELNATFRNMARLIARDEQERDAALAEKTVLLKEIHHRVKNNLQLIASVINLHLRQLGDPAARQVLQSIHERVLALSAVHRALYAEDRLATVQADKVIADLLARVAGLGATGDSAPRLRLSLEPLTLDADQMVPLSFLVHEALTNALKHLAAHRHKDGWIAVELMTVAAVTGAGAMDGGPAGQAGAPEVVLRLRNPFLAPPPADGSGSDDGSEEVSAGETASGSAGADGLGAELIEAFALQLNGTCRQEARKVDDDALVWELELRFPAPVASAPAAAVQAV